MAAILALDFIGRWIWICGKWICGV